MAKHPDLDRLSEETLTHLAVGETTLRVVDRSQPRNEVQRYFDDLVSESYKRWVEAGKPAKRREMPALRVDSPTEALAEEVRRRLRASAVHLKIGISVDPVVRIGNKWRVAFAASAKRQRNARK